MKYLNTTLKRIRHMLKGEWKFGTQIKFYFHCIEYMIEIGSHFETHTKTYELYIAQKSKETGLVNSYLHIKDFTNKEKLIDYLKKNA